MLGNTLTGYIRDTTRYLVILDSLTSEVSLLASHLDFADRHAQAKSIRYQADSPLYVY
jgi:hypothetical protein